MIEHRSMAGPTPRVPKYYEVKNGLLELTKSMSPGSPLPPERKLAIDFATSRTTVRQALAELVVEGKLVRIQGKGTFVARPKVTQPMRLTSYTGDLKSAGLRPDTKILHVGYSSADEALAHRLAINPGGRVLRLHRLRLANGEPMSIDTTYLSARRFPELRKELSNYSSLYQTLAEAYDVRPADAEEIIETVPASPYEAQVLGVDIGLPLLLLTRHAFDEAGNPIEWALSSYRGDRYKFVTRLRRGE